MAEFKQRLKKMGNSFWILVPNNIVKNELQAKGREMMNVKIEKDWGVRDFAPVAET